MHLFYFLFILIICLLPLPIKAESDISAQHAIVIEHPSGEVIFEKNGYEQTEIASLTKVLTALIVLEQSRLDEKVNIEKEHVAVEGSSIYLKEKDQMTVEDLLYGLMLRSGNDAATALAHHTANSVEGFVFLMNEKLKWLGLHDAQFANPHGLDNPSHHASSYDLAMMMNAAMKNESFRQIAGETAYKADDRTYSWKNKHKLVTGQDNFVTAGKTGFTKKAGRTLVTAFKKENIELIVVTLDGPDDWNDHLILFEDAYDRIQEKREKERGSYIEKVKHMVFRWIYD